MYYDSYGSLSTAMYTLFFYWVVFLIFQRITNRYPKSNSWKKDIILTFIESTVVLILLPIVAYFFRH